MTRGRMSKRVPLDYPKHPFDEFHMHTSLFIHNIYYKDARGIFITDGVYHRYDAPLLIILTAGKGCALLLTVCTRTNCLLPVTPEIYPTHFAHKHHNGLLIFFYTPTATKLLIYTRRPSFSQREDAVDDAVLCM